MNRWPGIAESVSPPRKRANSIHVTHPRRYPRDTALFVDTRVPRRGSEEIDARRSCGHGRNTTETARARASAVRFRTSLISEFRLTPLPRTCLSKKKYTKGGFSPDHGRPRWHISLGTRTGTGGVIASEIFELLIPYRFTHRRSLCRLREGRNIMTTDTFRHPSGPSEGTCTRTGRRRQSVMCV